MPNLGLPGSGTLLPSINDRARMLEDMNNFRGGGMPMLGGGQPMMPNGQPAFAGVNPNPQGANAPVQIAPGMGGIPSQQQVFGMPGAATVGMGGPAPAPLPQAGDMSQQQMAMQQMAMQQQAMQARQAPMSATAAAMGGQMNLDPRAGSMPAIPQQQLPMQIGAPDATMNIPNIPQNPQAVTMASPGLSASDYAGMAGAAAKILASRQQSAAPMRAAPIERMGPGSNLQPNISMFRPFSMNQRAQ